jgi:hypothetical protein
MDDDDNDFGVLGFVPRLFLLVFGAQRLRVAFFNCIFERV